ncbi:hypothetical protein D3C81_1864760 [compost metagenome]
MKKALKRFDIRLEGNIVTIETDRTRIGTLETLLKMIFHEFHIKKPEELDRFMLVLNDRYRIIRNKGEPQETERLDDFDFWKGLMEKGPREERTKCHIS